MNKIERGKHHQQSRGESEIKGGGGGHMGEGEQAAHKVNETARRERTNRG